MPEQIRRTQASLLAPLKQREVWCYGAGDVFGGGSFFIIGLFFLYFMTDVVGLSPVLGGFIFICGKLWDAFLDPFVGFISDKTHSRFGRRRSFLLFGAIPGGLSFALLWYPLLDSSTLVKFFYYLFSFMFFTSMFAILMIPYSALAAEIHPDAKQRNRLTGSRIFFSQMSVLVAGVLPKLIVEASGNYWLMGKIFGLAYTLPWFFVFFGVKESVQISSAHGMRFSEFVKNFKSVFENRTFKIHMGMYLCAYTAMDLLMALLQYFMKYVMERKEILTYCLGVLLLAQVIALPVYLKLMNSKGKGFAFKLGLCLWLAGLVPVGLLSGATPVAVLVALCALMGLGISAAVMIPWALLPVMGDIDELMTCQKRMGIYSGVMTFVRKLVQAAAIFFLGYMLQYSGYVPNQIQSAQTQFVLRLVYILGPGSLILMGIYVAQKLQATPRNHSILVEELERLRAGGILADAPLETQVVCEALTGKKFFDLYTRKLYP